MQKLGIFKIVSCFHRHGHLVDFSSCKKKKKKSNT